MAAHDERIGRPRPRVLAGLLRALVVIGAVVALLPFIALGRGLVWALQTGEISSPGVALSFVALLLGSVFFLYSTRYYLATLAILLSSLVLSNGNGSNGNGANGNGHHARVRRRTNGKANGNGNGNGGHPRLNSEPFVSIHIATYNERRVVGRLLEACAALEYGNYEVVLVDDSTDETAAILDEWRGRKDFKVIHRTTREGFKGGALAVALQNMDPRAEYVIVWDADVIPFPDSIQTFLPHFFKGYENGNGNGSGGEQPEPRPEVAAVQSYQWHVLNRSESWLTEAVRAEYAGSYMVERPFQEFAGLLKMIAGTAYMIRADLLREVGWGHSLTEDWELTLRLHLRGYKVVYTPYAESPAECVGTFGRLARQRMRWAEGHTYNVRRRFVEVMRSSRISPLEKLEFVYYSAYYLQAAFFVVGTACWLLAEIVLKAHLPGWTSLLGWSLLLTNLLSLPVLNIAGLLLEGAPPKDFAGVVGAVATSFLLVPFQLYAAIKGLLEKDEGPWYRTPKTGRVTDQVHHLRRLKWLRRWLSRPAARGPAGVSHFVGTPRRRPARRAGWLVAGALALVLSGLAVQAMRGPTVQAASTTLYLHGLLSFTLNTSPPGGVVPSTFLLAPVNASRTWATTSSTSASQTIFSTTSLTFQYWTTGIGSSTTGVTLTFAYSASSTCSSPTSIASSNTSLAIGSGLTTPAFSPASDVVVPAGSFLCFTVTVTALGVTNLTLDSDSTLTPTNLTSTQTIFIPELALPFVGLVLLAPIAARLRRRRFARRRQ